MCGKDNDDDDEEDENDVICLVVGSVVVVVVVVALLNSTVAGGGVLSYCRVADVGFFMVVRDDEDAPGTEMESIEDNSSRTVI
jgi:hypothetical protein